MKYQNVANHVFNQPWAILPETLGLVVEVLRYRMAGGKYTPEEIESRVDSPAHLEPEVIAVGAANGSGAMAGNVAVLPLYGVIAQRMNVVMEMSGGTSTEMFARQFQAVLADPTISAIVIQVDSPGGSVFGVEELATMIYKARAQKPVIAVADSMAASAAYWLACAALELWVTPGGMVGSVGCIAEHFDMSEAYKMEGMNPTLITFGQYKAEGNDTTPLTDESTAEIQKMVDSYGMTFVKGLAKFRGVSQSKVMADFGQGRMYRADEAVQRGMADKVGTLQDAIRSLLAGKSSAKAGMMAASSPPVSAGREPYKADAADIVKCPACGKMNDPDAKYCDQCGVKLPDAAFPDGREPYKPEADETVKCPACGKMNDSDAKYCDQCGEKLPDSAFADEAATLLPAVREDAGKRRRQLDILKA